MTQLLLLLLQSVVGVMVMVTAMASCVETGTAILKKMLSGRLVEVVTCGVLKMVSSVHTRLDKDQRR